MGPKDLVGMRDKVLCCRNEREKRKRNDIISRLAWDSNVFRQNLMPITFTHRSTYSLIRILYQT